VRDTFKFTYVPSFEEALAGARMSSFGTPQRIVRSSFILFVCPFGLSLLVALGVPPEMSIGRALLASGVFAAFWGAAFSFFFSRWVARRVVAARRQLS